MHAVILFDHSGTEASRVTYADRTRAFMAAGLVNKDLRTGRKRARLLAPTEGEEAAAVDPARIARAQVGEEAPESDHQVRAAGEDRR